MAFRRARRRGFSFDTATIDPLSTAIDAAGHSVLTGSALLPAGATMTIQAGTGASTQVSSGDFSVPLS